MKVLCIIIAVVVTATVVHSDENYQETRGTNAEERFLSLFSIVRFSNTPCNNSAGNGGVCMTSSECSRRGGNWDNSCATGFGVCCVESVTCGGTIDRNCTYFRNPGYSGSTSTPTTCTVKVKKCSPDVCAIRYDFEEFEISDPNGDTTVCETDAFSVLGGSFGATDIICGYNTGQHMYQDVGPNTDEVEMNMLIGTPDDGVDDDRKWSIKVSQIPCCSPTRPPQGCTQYFTENTGIIKSYNLKSDFKDSIHLARQQQQICIRPNEGMCAVQYYPYPADADTPTDTMAIFNTALQATGQVAPVECTTDYLVVSNAIDKNRARGDRFCGIDVFGFTAAGGQATSSTPFRSSEKPFKITFKTNGNENPMNVGETADANKGFIMQYEQVPC